MLYIILLTGYLSLTVVGIEEDMRFRRCIYRTLGRKIILGKERTSLPVEVLLAVLFAWSWGLFSLSPGMYASAVRHTINETFCNPDNRLTLTERRALVYAMDEHLRSIH